MMTTHAQLRWTSRKEFAFRERPQFAETVVAETIVAETIVAATIVAATAGMRCIAATVSNARFEPQAGNGR